MKNYTQFWSRLVSYHIQGLAWTNVKESSLHSDFYEEKIRNYIEMKVFIHLFQLAWTEEKTLVLLQLLATFSASSGSAPGITLWQSFPRQLSIAIETFPVSFESRYWNDKGVVGKGK